MGEAVKKESNARTYRIWFTILLIIVAVILFFVIPRTDYYQAFSNTNSVDEVYAMEDTHHRDIEYYSVLVYSLSGVTTANQDQITINNNITQSLFSSNDFIKKALVFVNHNADYNKNLAIQNEAKSALITQIENMQNYCETTLSEYLISTNQLPDMNNQVASIYINQLTALTTAIASFYNATAEIIEKSSTKGMEVNELTIAVNTNFNNCVQRILSQSTISKSTTETLKNTANTMFDNEYYKSFLNNTNTVNNVVATFNGIA